MVLKSAVQLVISQCGWVCSQRRPYGTYYIRVLDTDLYVLEIFYCVYRFNTEVLSGTTAPVA